MKDGQIVQVAYVVRDLDASVKRHWEVFGIGPWDIYLFESPKVENYLYRGKPATHKALIAVTWQGPVQLEVMQPVSGRCIYDEHLEAKARGCTTSSSTTPIAPRRCRSMSDAATRSSKVASSMTTCTTISIPKWISAT